MAESAACPGFQLGRPRYDQVRVVRLSVRCVVDILKAFGAENSPILRPADAATFLQSCFDARSHCFVANLDQLQPIHQGGPNYFGLCFVTRRDISLFIIRYAEPR